MRGYRWIPCLLLAALALPVTGAPGACTVPIRVRETLGERRFGYPVTVRVPLPEGVLPDALHAILEEDGRPLRGTQFDINARWPDHSVRMLSASFTASPGPLAEERFLLRAGKDVHGETPRPGVVEASGDAFLVRGTYRIPRSGPFFLDSVRYGAERLRKPAFWEVEGARGELPCAPTVESRVISAGPVNAVIERTGTYRNGPAALPYRLTLTQPASKSWLDATFRIEDSDGAVRRVSVTMPYAEQRTPLRWDVGVESWLYGTVASGSMLRLHMPREGGWTLFTGPGPNSTAAYARSSPARRRFEGWGHLIDGQPGGLAVAFGSPEWTQERKSLPGEVRLTAEGDVTLSWEVTGAGPHVLRALFHHVADPVPVTAVTSPASMIHPLQVTVGRRF